MMHRLLTAIAILSISGCATSAPKSRSPVGRVICSEGFAPLRFTPNADSLSPFFAKVIDWPAQAALDCSSVVLIVRGLPQPTQSSLEGRRATNVAKALQSFGAPMPSFELGDEMDQAEPSLQIYAKP
ncbi:hypothetical protein [Brevundimonas vesicularis]|uniref:hypothetical protein n=1 Tax=Brevundimonas vesicularis TaxID=41276 RepID=UPI0011BD4B65|nr:hypothetical protein [Brevundimonas vesicularis]